MELLLSNHAHTRFQQRGFTEECLDLLSGFGDWEDAPGGAMRIEIPTKEVKRITAQIRNRSKRLIQMIEKSSKRAAIVDPENNTAITVYIKR